MNDNGKIRQPAKRLWITSIASAIVLVLLNVSPAKSNTICNEDGQLLFESAVFAHAIYLSASDKEARLFKDRLQRILVRIRSRPFYGGLVGATAHSKLAQFIKLRETLVRTYNSGGYHAARFYYANRIIGNSIAYAKSALSEAGCAIDNLPGDAETAQNLQSLNRQLDLYYRGQLASASQGGNEKASGTNRFLTIGDREFSLVTVVAILLPIVSISVMFTIDYFENRKSVRYDVALDSVVIFKGATCKVCIQNISLSGARIGPNPGLAPGDGIVILLDQSPVSALIMWERNDHAGLKFSKKITKGELNKLRQMSESLQGEVQLQTA